MDKGNEKKSLQLGENASTANQKLRKLILFDFAKRLNLDNCFKCANRIEKIEDLSIEHKIPWLDSSNPRELYYDLNNIAFSHLSCNVREARKDLFKTKEFRENQSRITYKEFIGSEGTAWCGLCKKFLPKENFSTNNRTRSKTEWMCKCCRKNHRSK